MGVVKTVPALWVAGFSEVPVGKLMWCQTENNEKRCYQEERFTLFKARLGKETSGGIIELSVGEHVRDQKRGCNERCSVKKCFGEWGWGIP